MIASVHDAAVVLRVDHDLRADELDWTLQPVPPTAPMTRDEMLVEAIVAGFAYRLVLSESFEALRRATTALDQSREECIRLREAARR